MRTVITSDMTVYKDMPVSKIPITYYDETFTHSADILEAIKLFMGETVEHENGNRVSYRRVRRMFYSYWNRYIADKEGLKTISLIEIDITLKRYVMERMQWVTLHSRMWLAHVKLIPDILQYRKRIEKIAS